MLEQRHYPNAPIIEAVIDIRVGLADGTTLNDLIPIKQAVEADYPQSQELFVGDVQFQFGENVNATSSQAIIGYRFLNEVEKYIFQARLDGFTLSVLPPYDRWSTFRDEAKRLWEVYSSQLELQAITRVAVRYINRIDIPSPPLGEKIEQKDYFRTYPAVSDDYVHSDIEVFEMQCLFRSRI